MSGHTPGPWYVCEEPANESWIPGRTIGSEPTGTRVADACMFAFHGEGGVLANARLIAAAPDLLEALQAIVEADDGALAEYRAMGLGEPPPITRALTEQARVAIAKAKERHGQDAPPVRLDK